MIEDAHKGLEAMSWACSAMKMEEWGTAERRLRGAGDNTALLGAVGEKIQQSLRAPKPDHSDRGRSPPPLPQCNNIRRGTRCAAVRFGSRQPGV
jgi:hypothetical protein